MFTREYFLSLIISIPGLLLAISLHEFAHGYASYLMGDKTAKYQGRLSLNPIHHLDLMGTLCMLLFHFGWAKPVPIDTRYYKNRKLGIIVVSLAGPFANFLIGFISCLLYFTLVFNPFSNPRLMGFILEILKYSMHMNVGLMIFNLIPIPPLDGSKVLLEFLPYKARGFFYRYERYSSLILLLLVYMGTLTPLFTFFRSGVVNFYLDIVNMIF